MLYPNHLSVLYSAVRNIFVMVHDIAWLSYSSRAELCWLYGHACAFLFLHGVNNTPGEVPCTNDLKGSCAHPPQEQGHFAPGPDQG